MAIICTDNLLGNDTTGNGSAGLPYKTINKALSVAINGDEIRVAGSSFTQLPGTITGTAGSNFATTSNQTANLTTNDIIAVDTTSVDGWALDKSLLHCESIVSNGIFFYNQYFPFKTGTCLLYTSPSPRDRQKSRMPSSA